MSDDKVRLFFYGATTTRPAAWTNVREHPHDDALEGVWRPVADDDAREERIEKLRDEGFAMYAAHGDMTRDRDEWKARAERAEAVAQRLGRVLAELTNPYASPIIYTQPTTPDEYDTDTVRSYAMGARAGQYLALCIVKSAVARIDAEAGGWK